MSKIIKGILTLKEEKYVEKQKEDSNGNIRETLEKTTFLKVEGSDTVYCSQIKVPANIGDKVAFCVDNKQVKSCITQRFIDDLKIKSKKKIPFRHEKMENLIKIGIFMNALIALFLSSEFISSGFSTGFFGILSVFVCFFCAYIILPVYFIRKINKEYMKGVVSESLLTDAINAKKYLQQEDNKSDKKWEVRNPIKFSCTK